MERNNHLSENLKAYQRAKKKSLAEFSQELGVARSTVQSVMTDGNTTVDTLVRMANALHVSLDDLVFGQLPIKELDDVQLFLRNIGWFTNSHVISLANENTLIPIPASRKNKKLPLIFFQKVAHFPEKKSFRLSRLILLIELISSS